MKKTKVELEAKLTVLEPVDLTKITWPPSFPRPVVLETEVQSVHVFRFDSDDQYIGSVTDNRKIKHKSEPTVINVSGIPIMRREELVTPMPTEGFFKKFFSSKKDPAYIERVVHRTRTSVRLSDKLFVAYDVCTDVERQHVLRQLEVESVLERWDDEDHALDQISRIVQHLHWVGVKFELNGRTKYDWIREVQP